MGSPTIKFIRSPSVSISNGSKLLTVTGSVDTYHVYSGTVLFVGSNPPREAVSGTTVDNSGNSVITLTDPWDLPSVSGQPLVAFNSNEGLPEAIRSARSIGDLALSLLNGFEQLLNGTSSSVTLEVNGVNTNFVPYQYLVNQFQSKQAEIDSLTGSLNAMTKAEFFALAEQRKNQSAGSGFSEWGMTRGINGYSKIGEGLYSGWNANPRKDLLLGHKLDTNAEGGSNSGASVVNMNGAALLVEGVNSTSEIKAIINFPSAPDGTKTYDSASGAVVQHASAAIAFAAETATNKVITSRQDFVFIESWHEKISDKGVIYPLGNVQYGGTTYDGIALAVNGIAQGHSGFGEWDSTTIGNCAVWANLTDAQKAIFIQNPENNIYSDNGELIQVRYRVRVVEGLGDEWLNTSHTSSQLGYATTNRIPIQGDSSVPPSWTGSGGSNHFYGASGIGDRNIGEFTAYSGIGTSKNSHNGLCFAIPVALVQRRNQGVSHPTFNSHGCAALRRSGTSGSGYWYHTDARPISSKADCFNPDNIGYSGTGSGMGIDNIGDIATGSFSWNGDGKFYDAIYASDVKDLRMSSKKLPLKEIREKYKRMAIAGEVRGFEGVPFTVVKTVTDVSHAANTFFAATTDVLSKMTVGQRVWIQETSGYVERTVATINIGSAYFTTTASTDRVNGNLMVIGLVQTHKQANPTWTDIIGSPENIAATFPDGVEGQWIPVIPDGVKDGTHFQQNRKAINLKSCLQTVDNGTSWTNNTGWGSFANFNYINNAPSNHSGGGLYPLGAVQLVHYETQAHFTQDDDNSKVLDLGGVWASSFYLLGYGSELAGSLVGKALTASEGVQGVLSEQGFTQVALVNNLKLSGAKPAYTPKHNPISIDGLLAVKTLDYLSQDNNVAKLCYAYKEMVFDVTWGDNNQFEIASNQNTLTDDNGNTVLYGTASFDTQYFVVEE
jgi:hypothetical protein